MPTWRKILGLCFSVPLIVGGVALLVDAVTAERYLHGRYLWAVVFPIGIGVMWIASDWIMERKPS
jgi:hypothetical protein